MLEQQGRGKSTFQVASFIGGLHLVFLCGVLWIGCKKEDSGADPSANASRDPMPPVHQAVDPFTPPAGTAPPPVYTSPPPPIDAGRGYSADTTPPVIPPAPVDVPSQARGAQSPRETSTRDSGSSAFGSDKTYTVQRGDTGYGIATKNGITFNALRDANAGVDWNRLAVGRELTIPAARPTTTGSSSTSSTSLSGETVYQVKQGDTGLRIQRQFGVPWKDIRRHNRLTSDVIRVGDKLRIPAKTTEAVPESTRPSATGVRPAADQPGGFYPSK